MTQSFSVDIESSKAITTPHERELVRAALAKNPNSALLQRRLAALLVVTDQFDEAISVLDSLIAQEPDFSTYSLLADALLSRETEADTVRAGQTAQLAFECAATSTARASALAVIGKSLARRGEHQSAREVLIRALQENPGDRNACKRLAALSFIANDPKTVLAFSDELLAKGVGHSRLLAARTLALALLGDMRAAKTTEGLDQFHYRKMLGAPAGWSDIDSLNRALTTELLAHPALSYDRYGTASSKTWRIDEPGTGNAPYLAVLQKHILEQVEAFASGLIGEHPWLQARPARAIFHNWCVITDGPGFEQWHVHQNGWMSGVYYVAVPDRIRYGVDKAGCICFGLPEDLAGEKVSAAFGLTCVRPESGMLMMFPSHAYHRTFSHDVSDRRICLAFDIWPA